MSDKPSGLSMESLRPILDASPVAMVVSSLPDGALLLANSRVLDLFRMTEPMVATYTTASFYANAADRQKVLEDLQERGAVYSREVELRRADGTGLRCELSARAVELGGRRVCVAGFTDVTERARAQEALQRSETLFASMFRMSPAATILSKIEDGRCIDANEAYARMSGYTREELIGHSTLELNIWYSVEERTRVVTELARHGRMRDVEIRIRRKDGQRRDTVASGEVLTIDNRRYILSFFYDVTDRRQLEERLRQSEKLEAIGRLAGGVAHDFNNQLTAIGGAADLLGLSLADPQQLDYLEAIRVSSRRAAQLTHQLLAFARKGRFVSVPVDMHQIVAEVAQLLGRSIDKRIEVRQALQASRSVVMGDPTQLQNMLLNLALNARDAMPAGGVLSIRSSQRLTTRPQPGQRDGEPELAAGEYLVLTVEDSGIGMDAETRARLFEPFFTTKRDAGGTGLGLAAAYGTVRDHTGTIRVDSEPGKGSAFNVYLPLAEAGAKAGRDWPDPLAGPVRGCGRIMLVDDEAVTRQVLGGLLTHLGYTVTSHADGREAVDAYRGSNREVDLVVLDMSMPVMGGRETLAAMKAINPSVRALLVSGYSLEGEAQKALAEGALGFVQKPCSVGELSRAVVAALAAAR